MKRIGYAKLGRSMTLDPDKFGFQGDAEAPNLLRRLALRNPDTEFYIVGRNTGGTLELSNVSNVWDDHPYKLGTYYHAPTKEIQESIKKRFPESIFQPYSKGKGGICINSLGIQRDKDISRFIGNLDGMIVHIGQHGCSHIPIPEVKYTWAQAEKDTYKYFTHPLLFARNYGTFLTDGLNQLGNRTDGKTPIVWLCADPRNYLKDRSLKWPTGCDSILAQYSMTRFQRHERFKDQRTPIELNYNSKFKIKTERQGEIWLVQHTYEHGDLELMILPDDWKTSWGNNNYNSRIEAGIATTSFNVGSPRRSEYVRDWLLKYFPDADVFGHWDQVSLGDVPPGKVKKKPPHEFQSHLEKWLITLSLPALGSQWTVAKPYQCFAARVACFMVKNLDDHGWILPTKIKKFGVPKVDDELYSVRNDWTEDELNLARILRVLNPIEFELKAKELINNQTKWNWVVDVQNKLLTRRWNAATLENTIKTRLNI